MIVAYKFVPNYVMLFANRKDLVRQAPSVQLGPRVSSFSIKILQVVCTRDTLDVLLWSFYSNPPFFRGQHGI